ncbi:DUF971 domain-containing protein, partial [Corynebacterium pseudodiphtheriticum]
MQTAAAVADFRTYPKICDLAQVQVQADQLLVQWADGRVSPFHHQWLRDNCPCPACVYSVTREQVLEIVDVDADLSATFARIDQGNLSVEWSGGHRSRYDPGGLRAHAYGDGARAEGRAAKTKTRVWDSQLQVPVFGYSAVMEDANAMLQWLLALRDGGLTQIRGVPTEPGSLALVARRIAFIR